MKSHRSLIIRVFSPPLFFQKYKSTTYKNLPQPLDLCLVVLVPFVPAVVAELVLVPAVLVLVDEAPVLVVDRVRVPSVEVLVLDLFACVVGPELEVGADLDLGPGFEPGSWNILMVGAGPPDHLLPFFTLYSAIYQGN